MRNLVVPLCLALAACGSYPRDIEGTADRIEHTHSFKVGFADLRPQDLPIAETFVTRIERATGAKATIERGPVESQLARLESDELDLVMGEFAQDSPWITEVAIIEPLSHRKVGQRTLGLSPVAANGENRWIALIEREVRDSAGTGK